MQVASIAHCFTQFIKDDMMLDLLDEIYVLQ
jgi:hypothetical protein